MTETTVAEVMAELAALEDPKIREVNARHGDDHAVNLGRLRDVAKRLKIQQDLARELWATGDTAARLLSLLICRPKAFERDELDAMLRDGYINRREYREARRTTWEEMGPNRITSVLREPHFSFRVRREAARILETWLDTAFEGGRHERRVGKIERAATPADGEG